MRANILMTIAAILGLWTAWTSEAEARNMYFYYQDGTFGAVRIDSTLDITHALGDAKRIMLGDSDVFDMADIDSCMVRVEDVPDLRFVFPDDPDAEWVTEKEVYINATLDIIGNGTVEDADSLELTVKGRGNSTWKLKKKPMRLKFAKKTSICGFAKAKSYVLLADYLDESLMHNAVALKLAQLLEVPCSNHFMPCNVYVNDKYAGMYLLTEKIGINSASVDIDDETGVLLELSTEYDEKYKFRSYVYSLPVMIKDPDFDDFENPLDRQDLWQDDFYQAERRAYTKSAFDYFDLESFVNYMLVNDFILNDEIGYPKSMYIHKASPGTDYKYIFGPVWDCDVTMNVLRNNGNGPEEFPYDRNLWLNRLMIALSSQKEFKEAYAARVKEFCSEILPELLEWFDAYAAFIEHGAKMNGMRWPGEEDFGWIYRRSSLDIRDSAARLRAWIVNRAKCMSAKFSDSEAVTSRS